MMFGFLGKGKGKAGQQNGPPVQTTSATSSNMFSSQAAAALAAAAAAGNVPGSAGPAPTGRRLQGSDITVDLDALRPGEKVPELQVQPITLLKFDYKLEHTQQVAISSSFICYGLKAGHIRALNRNTASRALFKGHPTSLSHMAFFSAASNLLASASRQGDLAVRLLTDGVGPEGDAVPAETLLMRAQLALPPGAEVASSSSSPPVSLAWHPSTPQILAAGAGGSVNIFQVPTTPPAEQPPELSAPGIQYSLPSSGSSSSAAVTAVAFSPAGDLLVAADSAGSVHVWWLEGDGEEGEAPMLSWQPFSGSSAAAAAAAAAVASVQFLHQADDGSSILMTGDARNAALKLWLLPPAAALNGASPACLQAVQFVSSANGPSDVFCHAVVQRELQLLVLANTVRKQVYTLNYSLGGSGAAAFDYAAFWGVMQPILSLATGLEAVESQAVPGEVAPQQLLLYTVQTDAIQQYSINPALCSSSSSGSEDEAAAAAALPGASVAAADAASAAAGGAAAAADVEEGEEVSSSITAPLAEAAAAPTAAAEPAAAAETPAPVAAAVPPPAQLPTPGLLLHAKAAEQDAAAPAAAAAEPAAAPSAKADAPSPAAAAAADASADDSETQQEAAAVHENASTTTVVPIKLPPMPTSSLLHSAEKAPATPVAAQAPAAELQEASAAAPAAAAASADVAALQQQVAQLLEMQLAMAAQLQASSQQTVAGVKGELSRALKATEASLAKQVEASLKATAKRSEEERRKAAAKERGELAAQLEKSMAAQLGQVSAALQRDLLKGMADAAREQSRATVTAVVNSVSPVVAQAVAGSLQRELAGSAGGGGQLAAVLERSLASSLAQPLHEALRENFAASIIPAFERATQVMFGQVESAFTAWLADSSRTAGAAQSDAAASLSSSLQQLQAVVGSMRGDLADTSRSLSRIASSTASRAAEASSSGGARPRTAQQLEAGAGAAGAAAAAPADPRIEIGSLMSVRKYDEALVKALNTASLEVLVWACKQVDPQVVLGGSSVALSQTTLLSLVHQLSSGLVNDAATPLKLAWLAEAAPVVDPHDPVTAPHLKVVLTGVMSSLKALVNSLPQNDVMAKKGKITLHLFNSLLHQ
uniref:Enhancer of mRNA-decapping protein 4 C-terminal domain-containing protein n=1 Tax=Tetradesmus obliquus TaxID=3088 RepID=A0A383W407_TETOB|eukprot:jgi/Sobl393_1/3010/SZX71852.1